MHGASGVHSTVPVTDFFVRRRNDRIHYFLSLCTDSFLYPRICVKCRILGASSLAHTVNGECYFFVGFDNCDSRLRIATVCCTPSGGPRDIPACFIRVSGNALFKGLVDGRRHRTRSSVRSPRGPVLEVLIIRAIRLANTVNSPGYWWMGSNRREVGRSSARPPAFRPNDF